MKKHWAIICEILILVLLILAAFRLWQKLSNQDLLFTIENGLFQIILAGWTVWVAVNIFSNRNGDIATNTKSGYSEDRSLAAVTILIIIAFILTAQGMTISGKKISSYIPMIIYNSHFIPALAAGALYSILIWLIFYFLKKNLPDHDPYLFPIACLLSGIGLLFLFRLGPDIALIRKNDAFYKLFWSQLRSLAISLLIFIFAIYFFTDKRLESMTRKRYVYVLISIILITLTALFGTEINGRRLSINLGIMNFQTVEMVKILALLFMTGYFRYEAGFMESGKNILGLPRARYLAPYLTMWVLVLMPIFLQKDLGPTALIFALFMVIFYIATGSFLSVVMGVVILAGIGIGSYFAGFPSMVKTRVDMWLEPFHYSQNMSEAMWAVSSGGMFGTGSGRGFSHYIPVVQSDFNFIAIAEEWGLVGVSCVLACFILLSVRTFMIAMKNESQYKQMFISGLGALWMIQTLIIVGGNLGVLPLTGITLPFISYGGSSLLVNFVALGIVMKYSCKSV